MRSRLAAEGGCDNEAVAKCRCRVGDMSTRAGLCQTSHVNAGKASGGWWLWLVADYCGAVHVSDPLAARPCFVYLRKHPTYQRCLTTTNSTTFSTILLSQTLNGVLSLFLVFDDPVLTLPPWNQMRMPYAVSLHYLWMRCAECFFSCRIVQY